MENNELTIEKLVYGGEGLSRIGGRVVLTPFVLPGENANVAVEQEKSGVARGRVLELNAASAQRVAPPCPYFGRCGGCHYQHASYEYQLEQKVEILREVLRRVGKFDAPERLNVISGPAWGYRNRSQFHLESGRIGYLEAGTHTLCPITECPISSPRINETLSTIIDMMGDRRFPSFVRSLEVFTNETEVQINVLETERPVARSFFDWCAERIPGYVPSSLKYAVAEDAYRVSHRSFFQVNRFLIEQLVEAALEGSTGESALDLYAGVGLFAVNLARRFRSVTAVESSLPSVRDLDRNAKGITIVQASTEEYLATLQTPPSFILADPPRAGLGKAAVRELVRLRAPQLHIVACDPATLARDLSPLLATGYRIESMTMVDLFPQTYHLETIVRLKIEA